MTVFQKPKEESAASKMVQRGHTLVPGAHSEGKKKKKQLS